MISHNDCNKLSTDWLLQTVTSAIRWWVDEKSETDYWREPLVGVAAADDPLFLQLKQVVDPDHAMPEDLLPGARSVIAFFLPFKRKLGRENNVFGELASESWADCYVSTNSLIAEISTRIQEQLRAWGYRCELTPATHNFEPEKLISLWSHRHIAYIAGLGKFGHNNLLITDSGCCGRLGSLTSDIPLPPTQRSEGEFCLTRAGEECMKCVAKCKYGALFEDHFDRFACFAQLMKNDAHYKEYPLTDVCGKCACELPCSYANPMRKRKAKNA
jgi:epoxyqueuosine reductase